MTDVSIGPKLRSEHLSKALNEGPRSSSGDPMFTTVEELALFFDEQDLLALVNKALYNQDYQRAYHRKRAQEITERKRRERLERPARILKKDLKVLLHKERLNVDSDLGPQGAFDVPELDPKVPSQEELDKQELLNEAFARRPDSGSMDLERKSHGSMAFEKVQTHFLQKPGE